MKNWKEHLSGTEEPRTLIEIYGPDRLLVEQHRGIVSYSPERIRIAATFGIVCVEGEQLRLCCMSRQQLVIRGGLRAVCVEAAC